MFELDLIRTFAVAGLALAAGFFIVGRVRVLARYNVPAAVVGGLLIALLVALAHEAELAEVKFDTSLQSTLMIAFFTSIGFSASLSLLRAGSGQALLFLALASFLAVMQSLVGIGVAVAFGEHPLMGVLMSSTALAGGPATALAFAPQFAAAGVEAAESLAIAAAMAGIVLGGLAGGPIATRLLEKHAGEAGFGAREPVLRSGTVVLAPQRQPPQAASSAAQTSSDNEETGIREILRGLTVLFVAMALGSFVSAGFVSAGLTLPGYVGAMLVGALIRNIDDATGWIRLPEAVTSQTGAVCLTLFLTIALMNLKLWELASLALPLIVNLVLQVTMVAIFCWWVVFRLMGRDYDAAVMSGGFTGFMLGTTANAMAVMRTIVERFGPAPRAFLVAPLVGAFFIDFSNALIITTFLNLLG
jgi:ESS family glutamate:Na+ symporter